MSTATSPNLGTYSHGMAAVVAFVFAVLVVICVLDLVCAVRGWPSLGYRLQQWSRTNWLFVAAGLLILATLETHFAGNCIHYTSVCTDTLPTATPIGTH